MTKPAEEFTLHTESDLLAGQRTKLPGLSLAIKITDTIYYRLMCISSAGKVYKNHNIWHFGLILAESLNC